ncbi:UDP-glucose 4-epimerase GalE [Polynucleobacter paneuropaeus]|nr:UDP-glucose 4-epimerase GalE [Polynucleobacter paneuropaeus]
MNILLTGGAGYIGSHTAVVLVQAGHKIVIYDNFCNSSKPTIDNLESVVKQKVSVVEGDIRNTSLLAQTLKQFSIDAVIHFAGLKAVGESVQEPLNYYENNVQGTLSLLRAMNELCVKNIVFSSSATVYGDPQYLPIDEAHPLAPTNPYGRTKLHIEQILEDQTKADIDFKVVNLRYFNPVGAHASGLLGENPKGTPNNLTPFIARVASGDLQELNIFGNDYPTEDGTGVRDYIHVEDLADGHVAALNFLSRTVGFETFNLGTGNGCSVLQMIVAYKKASGKKIPYRIVSKRPGDIASCYAAPTKANQILKWKAGRTLQEMCESSWAFQQQLKNSHPVSTNTQ